MWRRLVCLLLIAGCPDVTTDPGETTGKLPTTDGPTVEFDPANAIIPFPNDLEIDPATHLVSLPAPPCVTAQTPAVPVGVLDTLDGFGTYEGAIAVTFTAPVDPGTLAGRIVMYQRTRGIDGTDPRTATPVPITLSVGTTTRYDGACNAAAIETVTLVPDVPLDERSTYTLAVLAGVATTGGVPFLPSPTWALVRQPDDPVTVNAQGEVTANDTPLTNPVQIRALDGWWKAAATGLAFLDATGGVADRSQLLVAWELTTQTTTDPLDPAIAGSIQSALPDAPLANVDSIVSIVCPPCDPSPEATLEAMLVANGFATADTAAQTCAAIHCAAIGDVLHGELAAINFQTHLANPIPSGDVPGPWSDPRNPVEQPGFLPALDVLAFLPASPPPAAGYPVVIFGHDLGAGKASLVLIAGALAANGIASVAIDLPNSGSRAVQISLAGACASATYATAPQCFAPFLAIDLPTLRDTIREGVVDLEQLVRAVAACGPGHCDELAIDPSRISYLGNALGGVLGGPLVAVEPRISRAVLAVPDVGWLDTFEQTESLALACPFVDALISEGVLTGALWDGAQHGLCTSSTWAAQPAYRQLARSARWILDAADGANFVRRLAGRRVLIQEVVGDAVVPNAATDSEGALAGLVAESADLVSPLAPIAPSAALAGSGGAWLRYQAIAAGDPSDAWGIAYQHASLLEPASSGSGACAQAPGTSCADDTACGSGDTCVFAGELGTARMQADAAYFLEAIP